MKKRPLPKEMNVCFRMGDKPGMECWADSKAGSFVVTSEGGGGGPPIFWEFDTFEEAIRCAREEWGVGIVDIYGPDGKCLNPDNWYMPQRINLVRLRRGPLNPRQEALMEEWLANGLGKFYHEVAGNPTGMIEDIGETIGDLKKAISLVERAWAYGLLEVIGWIDGTDFPDREAVDRRIKDGSVVAV